MNRFLTDLVTSPPIPEFKAAAAEIAKSISEKYDMSQAVPWFPTFEPIRSALREELSDLENSFYSPVPGLSELREEIAKQHPLTASFSADNVLVTSGANQAIYTALATFVHPGEEVVLPEPYYFNHDMALKMLGLKVANYPLKAADGFALKSKPLIEWLDSRSARALILVSPNNPTGAVYSPSEIEALLNYTSSKGIEVILDETYLAFDPTSAKDKSVLGKFIGKGLSLVGSFSKSYSLCGYRVGYLVCSPAQFEQALKVQDTLIIACSTLSQKAALVGLRHCQNLVQEKVLELRQLQKIVEKNATTLSQFKFASVGVFFAYLEHPTLTGRAAALDLFKNTGILGLPGDVFGTTQKSFIRLAYSNVSPRQLEHACEKLRHYDTLQ